LEEKLDATGILDPVFALYPVPERIAVLAELPWRPWDLGRCRLD
jgi:hypothetical protein